MDKLQVCPTAWPVEAPRTYTVRVSQRARHVRLRLSLREGLVVVVPRGFDQTLLPALLVPKQRWIERAWARLQAGHGRRAPAAAPALPTVLHLKAVGEEWKVDYQATASPHVAARAASGNRLLLTGRTRERQACIAALRRWLNRKAHQYLEPWLAQLAAENGFQFGRVLIKSPRTRWGSCSAGRTITLSLKLLFLPPELVRSVLLHELCHTVERNHSPRFWALLQRYDPDWHLRRKELRAAGALVPAWLDERQNRKSKARRDR